MPRATGLAAAIKDKFGIDAELIKGAGGIFDVRADDQLVFSKHQAGRFPETEEILQALASHIHQN